MSRKNLHAALGLAMVVFGGLQINDPDPWLWVPLYLVIAGPLLAAAGGYYLQRTTWIVLGACAVVAGTALPGFIEWATSHPFGDIVGVMSAERQYIEDSREFLGLVIAASCLGVLLWWPPRSAARSAPLDAKSAEDD